jgi:hypothetical protein
MVNRGERSEGAVEEMDKRDEKEVLKYKFGFGIRDSRAGPFEPSKNRGYNR